MAAAAPDATAFSRHLITDKGLSLDMALLVAKGALMKYHAEGYRVSLNPNHLLIRGTVSAADGVPIQTSTEVIMAIGVSGAPLGDKGEARELTAKAKFSNSLK